MNKSNEIWGMSTEVLLAKSPRDYYMYIVVYSCSEEKLRLFYSKIIEFEAPLLESGCKENYYNTLRWLFTRENLNSKFSATYI